MGNKAFANGIEVVDVRSSISYFFSSVLLVLLAV